MSKKVLEIRSKSVKKAVEEGLDHLQLTREDVSVKVLEEPARGLGFSSEAVVWLVYDAGAAKPEAFNGADVSGEEIETIDELPEGLVENQQDDTSDSKGDDGMTTDKAAEETTAGENEEKSAEESLKTDSQQSLPEEPLSLDISEDGTFLNIRRGESFESAAVDELRDFLEGKNIFGVSEEALREIADSSEKRFGILTPEIINVGTGKISILRKEDYTAASLIVYEKGDMKTNTIKSALSNNGVVKGINDEAIGMLLSDNGRPKSVLIAEGLEPSTMKYGELQFQIHAEEVDWRDADGEDQSKHKALRIGSVEEGRVIVTREIEEEGSCGYKVNGTEIKYDVIEAESLKIGDNIEISSDGSTVKALVSGHFIYCGGILKAVENVEVLDVVKEDIGEVKRDGVIFIRGNIEANGVVKAGSDVIIAGVLNNGTVESRGDVVIGKGISNDEGGYVRATGNLNAKSIVRSTVEACAVRVDKEIIDSDVTAGDTVQVSGEPGMIVGGRISAGRKIMANVIGDDSGTLTELKVGTDKGEDYVLAGNCNVRANRTLYAGVDITVCKANDKTGKEMSGTVVTQSEGRLQFSELD